MKKSWSKVSLTFFFVIALFGSIMRMAPFSSIFIDYNHILHAHSHIAFQGWVYTALFLLITKSYLTDKLIDKGMYRLQFILTIITLLGIMIAFIFQGYALLSILFSSLFQLLNYWFTYRFLKDFKKSEKAEKHSFSIKFIKVGFWVMILSTLGPWAIGILSAKGLAGSEYFNAALYFFLHFQYNGWFIFAILGLFFWLLEHYKISFKQKEANLFYVFFTISIVPTYVLSLLGMSFRNYIIAFGYIAAILQLIALFYLIKSLANSFQKIKQKFNRWTFILLQIVFFAFIFKIILQFTSVLPLLEKLAFGNRFLIMDYIHLVMIGFISFFILAIFFQLSFLKTNSILTKFGISLLIISFIASELILFGLGLSIPFLGNFILLFISSAFMATGILFIIIGQGINSKNLT